MAAWAREHGPAVRGYLRSVVHREEVVDDLYQEVFGRALEAQTSYQERGHARAYLIRIADRLVVDHFRREKQEINIEYDNWPHGVAAQGTLEPGMHLERQETIRQLRVALHALTGEQRRVLMLRYYGNLKFKEIAETMNCPLNTALSHCRRGLQTLHGLLKETRP